MEQRETIQKLLILHRISRACVELVVLYLPLLSPSLEVIDNQII